MKRHFAPLALTLTLFVTFGDAAAAETVAQTVSKWGLIGRWSVDCSLPPDLDKGAVFSYEPTPGGSVVHRRDFGYVKDKGEVLSAEVSRDGMLTLRVYLLSGKQTREVGLMMQKDGTIRAMYNRDGKNQYTAKDGKFTANNRPTPAQHKCDQPIA